MLEAVAPMQNIGLFGTRDFDKLVFRVPFAAFDPTNADHTAIAKVVEECEAVAAGVDVSAAGGFRRARTLVRATINEVGLAEELEAAVEKVLPVVSL